MPLPSFAALSGAVDEILTSTTIISNALTVKKLSTQSVILLSN